LPRKGTALGQDLTVIEDIRAMTGRVIEIRLANPMPNFLQLLAQPELGLQHRGQGAGPMNLKHVDGLDWLTPMPPDAQGLPMPEGWASSARPLAVGACPPMGRGRLLAGKVDVCWAGLYRPAPVQRGTLGKQVLRSIRTRPVRPAGGNEEGCASANREALSMAMDRAGLAGADRRAGMAGHHAPDRAGQRCRFPNAGRHGWNSAAYRA
jgi:hypothetical protein